LAASFANLTMHQVGANVVIGATASDFITLTHVTLASLTAGDFVFRG
jgi:hypothetical protein